MTQGFQWITTIQRFESEEFYLRLLSMPNNMYSYLVYPWHMNFTFILTTRFPTEKAYGVTTQGSIDALRELGHDVEVVSATTKSKMARVPVRTRIQFTKILHFLNQPYEKVQFKVKQVMLALKVFKLSRKKAIGVIWTREILPTFLIRFFMPRAIVVLELHQIPRNINSYLLKKIRSSKYVILAPIKEYIARESGIEKQKYVNLPMGVSEQYLACGSGKTVSKNKLGKFHVVYLGREINTHEKLNVEYLISNLQEVIKCGFEIEVSIVGIKPATILKFLGGAKPDCFHIYENLNRSEILNILRCTDIGLVIYPNTSYYRSTFPIKIVEYAATKNLIVASDTPSHREILGENRGIFFSSDEEFALGKAILKVIQYPEDIPTHTSNAFSWAKKHSYEGRVSKVLSEIRNRQLEQELQHE